MFRSIALALLVLASLAVPACAQQAPAAQTKRWTNADMDGLRERGLISIVGQEAPAPAPAAVPTPAPSPAYASRLQDPAWYAEQASELRAELARRAAAFVNAQAALAEARSGRGATGSFSMDAGDTPGVTPEEVATNLQAQVLETQSMLDELADLARRNDIAPGLLRSAAG